MYIIDQEISREIAESQVMAYAEMKALFQATEEKAEAIELAMRDRITIRTGMPQVARAIVAYSPLLLEHRAINNYLAEKQNPALQALMPDLRTPEQTALVAQKDIMLTDEEMMVLIRELRAALSTSGILDEKYCKKTNDTFEDLLKVLAREILLQSIESKMYKFDDIVTLGLNKLGSVFDEVFPYFKQNYVGYQLEASIEVLAKMDSVAEVRKFDLATFEYKVWELRIQEERRMAEIDPIVHNLLDWLKEEQPIAYREMKITGQLESWVKQKVLKSAKKHHTLRRERLDIDQIGEQLRADLYCL